MIDLLAEARLHRCPRDPSAKAAGPERTVYEITPAGREELHDWMTDLIAEPVKEYPQFEAALCLLPVLPPDEALALLRMRLTVVEGKVADLRSHLAEFGRAKISRRCF